MNIIWSSFIQGAETLFSSRALRFCDIFKDEYKKAFEIDGRKRILEIGCGPGALAASLSRWYDGAGIYAIDRDAAFIDYASAAVPNVHFSIADASSLPFGDETFDVTISNTVSEHVAPEDFYPEQYRVLKKGGVCLVLSMRKGVTVTAGCLAEETPFEKNIFERTAERHFQIFKEHGVGKYAQSEAELPRTMEKFGFKDVSVDYVAVGLTPDDPKFTKGVAHAIIESERKNDVDNAKMFSRTAGDLVSENEIEELLRITNEKYDRRIELYDKGVKQWDVYLSIIMIVRGIK